MKIAAFLAPNKPRDWQTANRSFYQKFAYVWRETKISFNKTYHQPNLQIF